MNRTLYAVWYMTKEELRMHSAMVGAIGFFFFPVMIFFISFVLSVVSPAIMGKLGFVRTVTMIHAVVILYGLGVGGLALAGKEMVERRFGEIGLLIQSPSLMPIKYRETFLAFYLKDLIYYLFLSVLPLVGGLALSMPVSHFAPSSVVHVSLCILLTFLFSISLSFFISAVATRSKLLGAAFGAAFASALVLGLIGIVPLYAIFPSVRYQFTREPLYALVTLACFAIFSVIAVPFVQDRFATTPEKITGNFKEEEGRFARFADAPLLAKEMIDMRRSHALFPMVGSFIVPLLFVYGAMWVVESSLFDIGANALFYSAMIGFFGMTVYSWQNNIDNLANFQTLPISVPKVIKVKLQLFFIVTVSIAFAFVVIVTIIENSFAMLPFALIVTLVSLSYTAITTAYLTGLKTNSYLFDAKVLARFNLMVALPLTMLCAFSMMLAKQFVISVSILAVISGLMMLASFLMYRKIEDKWSKCSFV